MADLTGHPVFICSRPKNRRNERSLSNSTHNNLTLGVKFCLTTLYRKRTETFVEVDYPSTELILACVFGGILGLIALAGLIVVSKYAMENVPTWLHESRIAYFQVYRKYCKGVTAAGLVNQEMALASAVAHAMDPEAGAAAPLVIKKGKDVSHACKWNTTRRWS